METVLAAVSLIVTVAIWLFDRYYVRRRRLGYRVHWDSRALASPGDQDMTIDLDISHRSHAVPDPSFVMLRIENVGGLDIGVDDVRRPISFRFPGRSIRHFEIQTRELNRDAGDLLHDWQNRVLNPAAASIGAGAATLPLQNMSPGGAPTVQLPGGPATVPLGAGPVNSAVGGEVLTLPPFEIRRKERIKMLFLLSGSGSGVEAEADLNGGGTIRPEHRRSSRTRFGVGLGALSVLLAGILVGLILTNGSDDLTDEGSSIVQAVSCPAEGNVSITGSTTMYPAISQIAAQYMQQCPDTLITVGQGTSENGLKFLEQGMEEDNRSGIQTNARLDLAMVDQYAGAPSTPETDGLEYWSVGVTPFVVVVNRSADLGQLTSEQLRQLYSGKVARWNSGGLGGSDEPVVLISRPDGSGTRKTFEHEILEGKESATVSSSECLSPNLDATAAVLHCEIKTQKTVLQRVSSIEGAIGYASFSEAKKYQDKLQIITLDGAYPGQQEIADNRYSFWAVEKLFRIGAEQPASVRDYFVNYVLTNAEARKILQKNDFYACNDPAFLDNAVAQECSRTAQQ